MSASTPMAFALAGEIVDTPTQAKRILVAAIRDDKHWLIPQAESVLKQLRNHAAMLAAAVALTACGCGADLATQDAATQPTNTPATATNTAAPEPTPEPAPVQTPAPTEPVGITVCPQSSADGCAPSPAPARPHPVGTASPPCDPTTTNCANTFGPVTS